MRIPDNPTGLVSFVREQGVMDAERFCGGRNPCLFGTRGDIERFFFHEYNAGRLRTQIAEATRVLAASCQEYWPLMRNWQPPGKIDCLKR